MLGLTACVGMTCERALLRLHAPSEAFDAAKVVIRTPGGFGWPIANGGSRDLSEQDRHREAVFTRHAAPGTSRRFDPGYRRTLVSLGIASPGDARRGGAGIAEMRPRIRRTAATMVANPEIEDDA